jgi:hypothetical protein
MEFIILIPYIAPCRTKMNKTFGIAKANAQDFLKYGDGVDLPTTFVTKIGHHIFWTDTTFVQPATLANQSMPINHQTTLHRGALEGVLMASTLTEPASVRARCRRRS